MSDDLPTSDAQRHREDYERHVKETAALLRRSHRAAIEDEDGGVMAGVYAAQAHASAALAGAAATMANAHMRRSDSDRRTG